MASLPQANEECLQTNRSMGATSVKKESVVKTLEIGLTILAGITGIKAAIYWFCSCAVPIEPTWPEGAFGRVEPGEHEESQNGWIAGVMQSNALAARLNAKAAFWTGISVLLTTAASIMSILS